MEISRKHYSSLDNNLHRDKYTSLDSMPNLLYSGQTSPLNVSSSRDFARDCTPINGDGSYWTSSKSHVNLSGAGTTSYDQGYNAYHSTMDGDTYAGFAPAGSTGHNTFYNSYGGGLGGGGVTGVMSSDNPHDSDSHPWTTGRAFYTDRDYSPRDLHPLQKPGYVGTDSNGNYPLGDYHSPWASVQPCGGILDMQHDVIHKHYTVGGVGGSVACLSMSDMDSHGLELSLSSTNTCGGGAVGSGGGGGGKRKRRRVITIDQRRAANVRERRRMSHLNEAFDGLRKRVPTFAYEKKLSRIDTLRLSVMYIKFMAELLDSLSVTGEGGCVQSHGAPGVVVGNGDLTRRAEKSLRSKRGGIRDDLSVDVIQGMGGGGQDVPRGLQRMSAAVGSVCTDDEDGEESYLSDPSEEEESGRGGVIPE